MKKIIKIEVFGLFGDTDHAITIDADKDFSIIYGPNGVGKTKVLEIAKHTSSGTTIELQKIDFKKSILHFDDETTLIAERSPENEEDLFFSGRHAIKYTYIDKKDSKNNLFLDDSDSAQVFDWVENNTSWMHINDGLWVDRVNSDEATSTQLLRRYRGIALRLRSRNQTNHRSLGAARGNIEFQKFQKHFSRDRIRLIDTQRLRSNIEIDNLNLDKENKNHYKAKIQILSEQMKDLISKAQTDHSSRSQTLDRNFPSEVLRYQSKRSETDIRDIYNRQSNFRSRLAKVINDNELSNNIELPEDKLTQWQINFLDRYLQDAEEKLDSFKGLIEKIESLESIINSRLNHKKLKVSSKSGLQIVRSKNSDEIPLSALSSGEQHEIILIFNLLFNVPDNCLVLIDEPEISLHVAWQRKFISDVQKIAGLSNFRFIIATHSPQIMGVHIDEAQRLGSPEDPWED